MAKIEFPKPLKELLEDSTLQAPIRSLADRVGEILSDNKLPFFPDYTDHGVEHINCVLNSEIELVPDDVWNHSKKDSRPRLLCDADAVVLIGATLLHDIAMHLRPHGFLELVAKDSRFQPLPWFNQAQESHKADIAWHSLWEDYVREAKRFSDRQLTNIIGEESARCWKFDGLPEDTGQWTTNHKLIVGEFIRRHHARLAHEIAIYGFPGVPVGAGEGQFPAMGQEPGHLLKDLADLIGLSARSHGMSLRVCISYLKASPNYGETPRPMGSAVLYPMALLRVADYLQIDRQRAPAVLLQLRNPQSPISVQEWQKHHAVRQLGPANDPRGKMVTVSPNVSLSLYLQLSDLINGLQAELDHSTAVLDEAYGTRTDLGLDKLNLAIRRVHSNLHSPAFRDSLPYIPKQTGFSADPNLLTLLVEPLYGKQPGVGVRELMQNAVDAVRELEAWCNNHQVAVDSLDLPALDGDVVIEFIQREDESWLLRVQDRGIGMTADTIQNHFLRAGASFRQSPEWAKEFLDEQGKPTVARAGRFGIGAFAIFLLGRSFKVWTRHVTADKSMGYSFAASDNSQLIEITREAGLPIGTRIEVEVSHNSALRLGLNALDSESAELDNTRHFSFDWFCWDWPKVIKRIVTQTSDEVINQQFIAPIHEKPLPLDYSVIFPEGYDAVFWTFDEHPALACNGISIESLVFDRENEIWPIHKIQLKRPGISVQDGKGNLPLTIQRNKLSQLPLPFLEELEVDVTLSFIAHALVCGPTSQLRLNTPWLHPLHLYSFINDEYNLIWCASSEAMIPKDPYLFKLLNVTSCIICGRLCDNNLLLSPDEDQLLPNNFDGALFNIDILAYDNISRNIAISRFEFILNKITESFGNLQYAIVAREEAYKSKNSQDGKYNLYSQENSSKCYFVRSFGSYEKKFYWRSFLDSIDNEIIYYIAEINVIEKQEPESLIAKLWLKCLGPNPIPFDPVARKALIAKGCEHPDLKRHIEKWQEMKRTGSKWVTGEQ